MKSWLSRITGAAAPALFGAVEVYDESGRNLYPDPAYGDDPTFYGRSWGGISPGIYGMVTATAEACVEAIVNKLQEIPPRVVRLEPGELPVPVPDHPVNALLENPSPLMTGELFWSVAYRDLAIESNAYCQIRRARIGREAVAVGLERHAPDRVLYLSPLRTGERWPSYQISSMYGGARRMRYWDTVTLHGPGFNPETGHSPSRLRTVAAAALMIQAEAMKMIRRNFRRGFGGKLYVYSTADQALTQDQIDTLVKHLRKALAGHGTPEGVDKIPLLQPGLKLDKVPASSPQELLVKDILAWCIVETCRALRVPPRVVYHYEGGTRQAAVTPEADEALFMQSTIIPFARMAGAELTRKILTPAEKDRRLAIRYPYEEHVAGTLSERAKIADTLSKTGGVTANEVRRVVRLRPRPDGDKLIPSKGAPPVDKSEGREIDEEEETENA